MAIHIHLPTQRKGKVKDSFSLFEKVSFKDPQYGTMKGYYLGLKPGNRVYIKASREENPKLARGQESFNVPMNLVSRGWSTDAFTERNPREFRRISSKIADLEVEERSESGATRQATLAEIAQLKKELTKYRDAVPEYSYEAVMKKIREGEWESENDVVKGKTISIIKYPSKQRAMIRVKDSAPSVGEKVRVQAEPGRMVEGTIRSLRGNMATVAYTFEGSPRLEDYHVTKVFSLAGKAFSPRDSAVGSGR